MSITDSLKNRKHVVDYSTTEIPTRKDIEEILRTALPLVTSKQKLLIAFNKFFWNKI